MDDLPRRKLCEIVADRRAITAKTGRDVLGDPKLCRALLLDLCAEYRREVSVLVTALEEGVVADLHAPQAGVPVEISLPRLVKRLTDDRAIAQDAARWAVESWALALKVIAPDQLTSVWARSPAAAPRSEVRGDTGPVCPRREPEPYEILSPDRIVWKRDGKEMVCVPAGKFLYGGNKEEMELPAFWIDRTSVTNTEYACFAVATGREPPEHWKGKTPPRRIADHPVTCVSWHDAVAYAEWAGKRLPTEEEWEKAARGTDGRVYPWGDAFDATRCNTRESGIGTTTPVGKYSPEGDSPYGCADMAGNVWEWTASERKPGSELWVLRGGAFNLKPWLARCAYRGWYYSSYRFKYYGFRMCVAFSGFSGSGAIREEE